MPENEKQTKPDNTDTSLPQKQWEQKLREKEQLAALPAPQPPAEQTPKKAHKYPSARGVWSFFLLAAFAVSAVCGVYLTIKPVSACKEDPAEKQRVNFSKVFARSEEEPGVAWIKVRGIISQDDNSSPFARPSGASVIAKKIREAGKDKNVKAIVLDINSPGGTVASVQNIYSEILKAKESKKVVALFRDVAASGGFYIAMAADKIVAEPGTITGSVGVIMQTSNVEGLFDKIGVKVVPITSGKYKDIGSSFRPMSDAEKAILQDMVNDTYTQFFAAVKAGRPDVKPEDLAEYTDGRVFTGQRAYNLGFVDKLGGEQEALALAGELAGLKDPKILSTKPEGLRELIFSFGSSVQSQSLAKQLQSLATPSVSYLWVN